MPNWCDVSITISGDTKEQKKFLQDAYEEYLFSINPQNSTEAENKGLFYALRRPPNGKWDYDWCCDNWGTKWDVDADESCVEYSDGELTINGQTAWAPPIQLLDYLHTELDLHTSCEYSEAGCGFAGVYEDGNNTAYNRDDYWNSTIGITEKWYCDDGEFGTIIGEPEYNTGDLFFWDEKDTNKKRFALMLEELDYSDADLQGIPECVMETMYGVAEFFDNNEIHKGIKILTEDGVVYDAIVYKEFGEDKKQLFINKGD